MKLGKKIRALRLEKSVTQEQLANVLHVSGQAVSKWENDTAMPDICILPELSVFFGVTLDELFDLTTNDHYQRIENLLERCENLSYEEFRNAESLLKDRLEESHQDAKARLLLTMLYNKAADSFRVKAEASAKEYLSMEPEEKEGHTELRRAQQGTIADWDFANHHKRIAYYQEFIREHPSYARGYLWLLDELLADGRLAEAEQTLKKMAAVDKSFRVQLYRSKLAWARGEHEKAEQILKEMEESHSEEWIVSFCLADHFVHTGQYETAIFYYEQGEKQQPSPKYTDSAISRAHIYEIMGEPEKAIQCWEHVKELLETEWNVTEGAWIEEVRREIRLLQTGK